MAAAASCDFYCDDDEAVVIVVVGSLAYVVNWGWSIIVAAVDAGEYNRGQRESSTLLLEPRVEVLATHILCSCRHRSVPKVEGRWGLVELITQIQLE